MLGVHADALQDPRHATPIFQQPDPGIADLKTEGEFLGKASCTGTVDADLSKMLSSYQAS